MYPEAKIAIMFPDKNNKAPNKTIFLAPCVLRNGRMKNPVNVHYYLLIILNTRSYYLYSTHFMTWKNYTNWYFIINIIKTVVAINVKLVNYFICELHIRLSENWNNYHFIKVIWKTCTLLKKIQI